MSLLIKALKQAERSHRSGEGLEADDPTAAPVAAPAERAAPVANTATPKDARASREADAADVRPAPGQRSTPGDQPGGRDLPEAKADWSMLLEIPDPAPPREAAPEVAKPPRPVSAAPTPAIAMMEMDAIDTPAAPSPTAPGDDGMAFDDAKSELSFAPLEHALEPAPMEFDAAQVVANQDDAPERAEPTQEMHDASSIGFEPAVAAEPVIAAVQATRPADKPRAPEQSAGRVSAVAAEIDAGVRSTHSAPQAQLEQAQPAAKKSGKRNSYALLGLLLLIGLSIGGWFGYQTMSVPDLSQFEANTPDPMLANQSNAAATGSGNTPATGSGNAAGLEPATNASAGPDPMLAEGGEVASSIDDGRVLTLAFAPAASPADSLSTKTVVANPKPAGIDGAQSAATRPSAATRKAASGSETEARSTAGSAAVQPADRQPANPAGSVRPPAAAARPAPPSDAAAPADSASEAGTPTVRLRRALSPAERIAMVKAGAYRSFRQNRLAEAEKLYRDVLVRNPLDTDAWIGLAAIAARNGDNALARQQYERALTIDPNDPVARAGLLSVTRDENPTARESRLRNLIASGLSGPSITFELANALAEQDRWVEAQQAYFEASSAEPRNADFAFNLAISLDRLHQPAPAIQHYERAIALAASGAATFDPQVARQRVADLRSALQR